MLNNLSTHYHRDIPQCGHLMDIHQGRKVEMDAKEEKFTIVFNQAEGLVAKHHYASEQINERISNLRTQKGLLEDEWDVHWEDLQLCTLETFYYKPLNVALPCGKIRPKKKLFQICKKSVDLLKCTQKTQKNSA